MIRSFLLVSLLTGVVLLPIALSYASGVADSDAKPEERTLMEKRIVEVGRVAVFPFVAILVLLTVLLTPIGPLLGVVVAYLVAGIGAWMCWSLLVYGGWKAFRAIWATTKEESKNDA